MSVLSKKKDNMIYTFEPKKYEFILNYSLFTLYLVWHYKKHT